jgi:DNA processing protein
MTQRTPAPADPGRVGPAEPAAPPAPATSGVRATLYGLPRDDLHRAIGALRAEHHPDELPELVARAAWTGLAEPGDGAAGLLVETLGAEPALRLLLDRSTPAQLVAAVLRHGAVPADGLEQLLGQGLERWSAKLDSRLLLRALRNAANLGLRLLAHGDVDWPVGLDDLGVHGPLALWTKGRPERLAALGRSIALVGARAATAYGEQVAMEAAAGLVDRGFAVLSGAAYGIDGMAHRSALASEGVTVAVLAGGLDRYYPSGHEQLLRRIADEGAVVSELPPGAAPTKWRFLQRNRLIAAMSQATIVLEAGRRSGSLNTAGHASALARPLGAVPGPVTSPASAGCHRLLREYDAVCVTTAEEMAELAPSEPEA